MNDDHLSTEHNIIIHDTQVDTHRRPPVYFVLFILIVIVGCLMVGLTTWQTVHTNNAERMRDCERAVATRTDGRSMWLYLIESSTSADKERVKMFTAYLNERLPELECNEDGNPVPRKE